MPEINLGPFFKSITIALVLFAIGRFIVIQTEELGRWVIFIGLVIFYAVWWVSYRRGKRKE